MESYFYGPCSPINYYNVMFALRPNSKQLTRLIETLTQARDFLVEDEGRTEPDKSADPTKQCVACSRTGEDINSCPGGDGATCAMLGARTL